MSNLPGGAVSGRQSDKIQIQMINIRSARSNLDLYVASLLKPGTNVIILTETWLYSHNEFLATIPGFVSHFASNDRYRSGGVAIFVRNHLVSSKIDFQSRACDLLLVELIYGRSKLRIAAIYRSPSQNMSDPIEFVNHDIVNLLGGFGVGCDCLIMGDINLSLLSPSSITQDYLQLVCTHGFHNLNDSIPTRIEGTTSSLIDHVFAKLASLTLRDFAVVDSEGVSDHKLISLELEGRPIADARGVTRRVDYFALEESIGHSDWSPVLQADDPHSKSARFQDICAKALRENTVISITKSRNRPLKEWMTPGLVKAIRKRSRLYRKYKAENTMQSRILYEAYHCRLRRLIKRVKSAYMREKFREAEGSALSSWRLVNSLIRGVTKSPKIVPDLVGADVDSINSFFAELGVRTARAIDGNGDPLRDLPPRKNSNFPGFSTPTELEIKILLKEINPRKSTGPDGLPAKLFKTCCESLAAPIHHLIESIISTGIYPDNLKLSLLHPVHKGGTMAEISNYRPISLLPITNKVIERVLASQLSRYVEDNNLLSENQYGFRIGRNCEQAAI